MSGSPGSGTQLLSIRFVPLKCQFIVCVGVTKSQFIVCMRVTMGVTKCQFIVYIGVTECQFIVCMDVTKGQTIHNPPSTSAED